MAPKKSNKAVAEPAAKKAKTTEEEKAPDAAPPAEEQAPEEKETDAKADSRQKIKQPIAFESCDSTLNVIPTAGGRVLTCLSDAGMQYLIAGARANVGAKAGRYLYEVRVLESMNDPYEENWGRKHAVRVGFSTKEASLILDGTDAGAFYFDIEGGHFHSEGLNQAVRSARASHDTVVGVLLNLDPKSPNACTLSIFHNGVRRSEPMKIPESLHGKPLFPHIAYRSVSLQVNFGPEALKPLPFKCRLLGDAASADVSLAKVDAPKDGKHEVIFPVGLPDEGVFDWTDSFLAENPGYVELSDRKILEWASKSGLKSNKQNHKWSSNDKPALYFDGTKNNFQPQNVINAIASVLPRNYVVMELKQNLLPEDRKANLKKFPSFSFKHVARVVMGEPSKAHMALVKTKILKDKQQKADAAWRAKKAEKERQKKHEARKKEVEEAKKKAQEKKKAEEEKKEEKKSEEGEATEEKEDAKMEIEADAAKEEDKQAEDEPEETEPPAVTLTAEEEAMKHFKGGLPDIATQIVDKCYVDFSIPEKSEGFDDIKFEWDDAKKSTAYLRQVILEKKRTSRVEDLQPGEWFKAQQEEWTKMTKEWQAKQKEAKAKFSSKKKGGDDDDNAPDLFAVEDVNDIGDGEPLYLNFENEDWALATLRWQLYTLAEAFKKDVNDPERLQIPQVHVAFYYAKYFKTQLNPASYGKESQQDLIGLVKDTVSLDDQFLSAELSAEKAESLAYFVKLAEENRRQRQRRIDAGDETARLKLSPILWGVAPAKPAAAAKTQTAAASKTTTPPAPPAPPAAPSKVVAPPAKGGKAEETKGADKGAKGGKNDKGGKGDKGGKTGKDGYGKDGYGKGDKGGYGKDGYGKDGYGKGGYGKGGGKKGWY